MLRKFIKLSLTASLLSALAPATAALADASLTAIKESIKEKPELEDLKITRTITLPETDINPGDTVIVITRKGLLQDITYTIPVSVSRS